jgi:GNAT superfamily N-acetyltransferase
VSVTTGVYAASEFPQSLAWQALSFLRCEWPFLFAGDSRLRTRPFGGDDTACVARTEGDVLLSYAEVLRITAVRAGRPVQLRGLSNVFTFPPYRGNGHASAIIETAGKFIDASDAEMAMLFCDDALVPFYRARGWQLCAASSVAAPGTAPATMARPGPALQVPLSGWLAAAPVLLDARW